MHTPKEGILAADDAQFFIKNYAENQFIQTYMNDVDARSAAWAAEQTPKVAKAFLNDFMKYVTEASPMRTARKQYQES